jgi:outer membrane lipoprotein-sorting protein
MRKGYLLFLLISGFVNIQLQSQNQKSQNDSYQSVDPKAKQILDQVSAKTKSYKSIEAEFSISLNNKQEKVNDTKKGKIFIKNNKYKIDLTASTIYYDGKTQWTYMKDPNEVNISTPDPNDDNSLNPAKIFIVYEKGFKIKFINEKFEKNHALYEIELYPIDIKKEFSRITLQIDKDKMQIFSMKRFGRDGTDYYIEIGKFEVNKEMDESLFLFDKAKYPKVEINDMR